MKAKKVLALLLSLVMVLTLAACGGTAQETAAPAADAGTTADAPEAKELSGEITFWHCFTQAPVWKPLKRLLHPSWKPTPA